MTELVDVVSQLGEQSKINCRNSCPTNKYLEYNPLVRHSRWFHFSLLYNLTIRFALTLAKFLTFIFRASCLPIWSAFPSHSSTFFTIYLSLLPDLLSVFCWRFFLPFLVFESSSSWWHSSYCLFLSLGMVLVCCRCNLIVTRWKRNSYTVFWYCSSTPFYTAAHWAQRDWITGLTSGELLHPMLAAFSDSAGLCTTMVIFLSRSSLMFQFRVSFYNLQYSSFHA